MEEFEIHTPNATLEEEVVQTLCGGHFAGREVPEPSADEIREFFREFRP